MKNIGLLVAVELKAVISKYKDELKKESKNGFDVYILERNDYKLHFVHTNLGLIRAAAGVQMLVDIYKIDFLINFGVVGALRESFAISETCFVEKVIHYDMDTSAIDKIEVGRYIEYPDIYLPTSKKILDLVKEIYPDIPVVTCASADKFLEGEEKKKEIASKFDADICDMESAAVVLISDLNGLANLIIKTVSDSVTGGADEYEKRSEEAADMAINIVEKILDRNLI